MNRRGKGIAISYIYTILNTVIGFFMSAFILRMLGKTDYGVYQTMTSFLTYLTLFEFGTGTIMTRNISLCKKDGTENDDIRKNISTVWTTTCILSAHMYRCIHILSFDWYNISQIPYSRTNRNRQVNFYYICREACIQFSCANP